MRDNLVTTYTHTCDLCGAEAPRGDLRRLGLTTISEGGSALSKAIIEGDPCDICPACRQRPITELLAFVERRERDHPNIPVRIAPQG